MPERVESLRQQLRERGYLSRGIERWFALDPWSSRTFWVELATVGAKAATLVAAFGALPTTAVMLARNHPLSVTETLELYLLYAVIWFATAFAEVVLIGAVLKMRPEVAIDTPATLLAISIAASALLAVPLAVWWSRFDTPAHMAELAAGVAFGAAFFVVASIVVSAALLSFSIYELKRIPTIHQKSRTLPLTAAAALLVGFLLIPAFASSESQAVPPQQVATTPTHRRLALVAADGLTAEILRSRPDLVSEFTAVAPTRPASGDSAAERWASVGTGLPASLHGVRSVDGVRLAVGRHVLQSVSRFDVMLREVAPRLGIARREPLPPTVRRRDFVWEIVAGRGVPVLSVNWWTSEELAGGALTSVGQAVIFGASHGDPIRLDAAAVRRLTTGVGSSSPQLATVYLPALDVILNRVPGDASAKLASSIRVIDGIAALVRTLRGRGYDVILAGMPGEGQAGHAVIATTFRIATPGTALDVAPTVLALFGFPPSREMPGRVLAGTVEPPITTYGSRQVRENTTNIDQEYYQSLKSLGYIR